MNPARLLMIDLSNTTLTPDERAFLSDNPVGGVCLFGRNIQDRFQVADYSAELREVCGQDLIISIDQEGGGVVRALDVPYPASAMALGAANDELLTRQVAAATARGLKAMGVNLDLAPVADVNNNPHNPVIGDRSFGSDPQHVSRHVVAFTQGLQGEGVAACAKHFPGHGDTATDSHLALPRLEVSLERLYTTELPPFRAAIAAGVATILSYHGIVTALDPENPATLSRPIMTDLLRNELGFDGVIITDALNMHAIAGTYGLPEASVRALEAGVDMPFPIGSIAEHMQVVEAIQKAVQEGRLEPQALARSVERITRLARRYPVTPDPAAAWGEGDEALIRDAARRALVKLGDLQPLERGSSILLIAAEKVVANAASDMTNVPARALGEELGGHGYSVRSAFYDRENISTSEKEILERLPTADTTLFISTSRIRMGEEEKRFAQTLATQAKQFIHVTLWNPYHATDLPAPALVTFGFRPASASAAAQALMTGEATGVSPVRLETV